MESVSIDLAVQVGGLIVAAAVLVVGMKFALNGLRGDMREIKADMKLLLKSDAEQNVKLAEIETEADATAGWIRRIEEGFRELRERFESRREQP